jgi:hypothetical protein
MKYLALQSLFQHQQPFAALCLERRGRSDPADASSSSVVRCQSGSRTRLEASRIFRRPIHLCSWRAVLLDECLLPLQIISQDRRYRWSMLVHAPLDPLLHHIRPTLNITTNEATCGEDLRIDTRCVVAVVRSR